MTHLASFLFLASFLIAMILLLNMIPIAFKKGFKWGMLCILFPPGTYIFCKKNWNEVKNLAIPILICLILAIVFKLMLMI